MPPDDSWESDAVWKLLDEAPPRPTSKHFTDNVVRTARLSVEKKSWWNKLFSPTALAVLATATPAVTFAVIYFTSHLQQSTPQITLLDSPHATAIQDIAETETLIAAVDQLDDFSDPELVSLIGF